MDIIEDFGPLLIIAISALFAFFKEKGKDKEDKHTQSDTILETWTSRQEPTKPKRRIQINDMPGDLFDDKREHLEKAPTTSVAPTAESESEYVIKDIEELKRAIIYSEILNRKY
jgi:polysaccharide deacetylase 2 family uncharacterized protein YibQ